MLRAIRKFSESSESSLDSVSGDSIDSRVKFIHEPISDVVTETDLVTVSQASYSPISHFHQSTASASDRQPTGENGDRERPVSRGE